MFIKKGKIIFFVVIVSLFAFIALASNICRAETWQITIDDTYDPIANNFTYISRLFDMPTPGTRRINIVGHNCTSILVTGEVHVVPTLYKGEPLAIVTADVLDATLTGGTVTANIILPKQPYFDSLVYLPSSKDYSVETIKVVIRGTSLPLIPTDFAAPYEVDGFYPDPVGGSISTGGGMKVYNFFNAYMEAEDYEYNAWLDDPILLSFVGLGDANQVAVDSGGYDPNRAELLLDFKAYLDQNLIQEGSNNILDTPPYHAYDYKTFYTDRAGNQKSMVQNNIRAYKYIDPTATTFKNAYTAFDESPMAYKIIFPNNMLSVTIADPTISNYVVNGHTLSDSTISGDVITLGTTDIAALGYTPETWTLVGNKITVAHISSPFDFGFGVDDGVGPRLMTSEVDETQGVTILTFSEPLKDNAMEGLDLCTASCMAGIGEPCLCGVDLDIDPNDATRLILDTMLDNNEEVWVADLNTTNEDIMDLQGNLAQQNHVFTVTVRRLDSITATNVTWTTIPNGRTWIDVTFNDVMNTTDLDDPNSYRVELVSGLVAKYTTPSCSEARIISATYDDTNTVVTLEVDGVIEHTDADRLPKVEVVNTGLLGNPGGSLLPPYTLPTGDEVGPYIGSATFDENGYYDPVNGWHGEKNLRTDNKLRMTFSEPVVTTDILACLSSTTCWPFQFRYPSTSLIGTGAILTTPVNGDDDIIEIQLGDNSLPPFSMAPHEDPHNWIRVKSANSLFDLAVPANNASDSMVDPREVDILDVTLPYIVEVKTVDGGGGPTDSVLGKLDGLAVEFDANVVFGDDPNAQVPLMADVGGISIELRDPNGVWTNGHFDGDNGLYIDLPESIFTDTGATPELSIYFDQNDWLEDTTSTTHSTLFGQPTNYVRQTVTVPSSRVIDDANPQLMLAEYQKVQVLGGTWKYMMTMTFSELIDPNVWLDSNGDFKKVAGTNGIFEITNFGPAVIDPNDCEFDPYEMTDNARDTLMFSLFSDSNITNNPPNFDLQASLTKVWDINEGLLADDGIYGSDGLESVEFIPPPSAVDTALMYDPKFTTNCAMMVCGTVDGLNAPNTTLGDWVVAAYTEDDLYHYRPSGGSSHNSWWKYQTATVDDEARMAVPGSLCTCLGSTNVQLDGTYCLLVYGNDGQPGHETAFEDGANKPVFLALIDTKGDNSSDPHSSTDDQAYLVSGAVEDDVEFYLPFVDSYNVGPQTYAIDLSRQERITLYEGWNCVSTSVKKNYQLAGGLAPQVLSDGTGPITIPQVAMTDINYVFASIRNQWRYVSAFDAATGQNLTDLNEDLTTDAPVAELPFFTVGYGLWIYIPVVDRTTLTVFGDVITAAENDAAQYSLPLFNGWNFVGHWGGHVKFADASPNPGWFSTAYEDKVLVPSVENVFGLSVAGPLLQARSFRAADGEGVLSWYSTAPEGLELNLDYAGPGTGTCLNMDSSDVLIWDALP